MTKAHRQVRMVLEAGGAAVWREGRERGLGQMLKHLLRFCDFLKTVL